MLKLIPQEIVLPEKSKLSKIKTRTVVVPKLKQKLVAEELKMENHLVKSGYAKLVQYLKRTGDYGVKEMGELIHVLQKSVHSLENKRTKLLKMERRNRK